MHAIAEPCPTCGEFNIHRSRWRVRDFGYLLRLLRPLRCHDCGDRFYTPFFDDRSPTTTANKELVFRIRLRNPNCLVRALAEWLNQRSAQSD